MRLPDINYGVGNVMPLAKKSTAYIDKNLETDINLSNARLGAELNKQDKIGNANIQLARHRKQVAIDLIKAKADIQNQITSHTYQQKTATTSAIVSGVSGIVQAGISTFSDWYAANEESKVAKGITGYAEGLSNLTTELSQARTIDLNRYQDVDFSSIPEHMIYSGKDAVTGEQIKSAPGHLAVPLIFAAREETLKSSAMEGIDSNYSQAQFENGIAHKRNAAAAKLVKASYDHEAEFLSGQYSEALRSSIGQEDFATSIDIINSAEARGVWSLEKAAKARTDLTGDIVFTKFVRQVDQATSLEQLKDIRQRAGNLPKSDQISIRSVVNQKEIKMQRDIEAAKVKAERTRLNLNTEKAMNAGFAAGTDYESQRKAVVKFAQKVDPENLNHYTSAFRTRYNQSKNAERARVSDIVDQAAEALVEDPRAPIPPEATGQDYINLKKLKAQGLSGEPRTTDIKRWNDLYDMATNEPDKFKSMPLGGDMANLSQADFKYFKKLQGEMRNGSYNPTQTQGADSQFNSFARQAFGKNHAGKEEALQLKQAYINAVDQLEAEKKGKSTAAERLTVLNDLFSARVSTYDKSRFGGIREKSSTLIKSEMTEYIPAISAILKQNKISVTADNIAKQYNFMLKNGTLEELKW